MPHTSRETLQLTILQPYNQHENPRFDKINLAVSCKISNFVIAFEPLHQGGGSFACLPCKQRKPVSQKKAKEHAGKAKRNITVTTP